MKATGLAIVGGLLKGVGSGLQADYEDRRQLALANLKRGWDQEDAATAAAAKTAADARDFEQKKELLKLGAGYDAEKIEATGQQNRLTKAQETADQVKLETVKFNNEASLERLKSTLDIKEDAASKRLAAEIDKGQVKSIDAAEDGTMLVTYNNGDVIKKTVKLRPPGSAKDDDEGGTIADAQNRRGGAAPKPAAEAVAESSVDANRMRTLYANATPEKAPRLFRGGKKIPYDEFERLMKGGQ